jgi:hypothetical protein
MRIHQLGVFLSLQSFTLGQVHKVQIAGGKLRPSQPFYVTRHMIWETVNGRTANIFCY